MLETMLPGAHHSAMSKGITEFPMSAQWRRTANSSWRSSAEVNTLSVGLSAAGPPGARERTDVTLL